MMLELDKKKFCQWLEIKGLALTTRTEYLSYIEKAELKELNQTVVNNFLQRYNNNVARATIRNLIQYLKMMKINVDIEIPKITGRKKRRLIKILSEEEVLTLANNMKTERGQLMVLISFYGGLRISELVGGHYGIIPYSFNWASWIKDPSQNGVLNLIGKGNKERRVFIPQKVMARLYQWINEEVSQHQSKEQKLFAIGERRWKQILSKESKRILGRHINPHLLRHSCNQWLRDKGWDVTERQKYLGHENPSTTMVYDHTNQEDLKKKFKELF